MQTDKLLEACRRIPFLSSLPRGELTRLKAYARLQVVRRGESIWVEGQRTNEFMFLVAGRVKFTRSGANGLERILHSAGPGELLCAPAPCSFGPYCCRAAPMEDHLEVLIIPRRDFLALLERCPAAAPEFIRETTCRSMDLCNRIDEVATTPVAGRICKLLSRLAGQVGAKQPDGTIWISFALSRQDLADMCATTVETAIRVMTQLRKEDVIHTVGGGFVVTDLSALRRRAGDKLSR